MLSVKSKSVTSSEGAGSIALEILPGGKSTKLCQSRTRQPIAEFKMNKQG